MGSVWVAENTALGTLFAVKFLTIASQDELTLSRFRREAATASQIKSPHVVQIFDHGLLPDNTPYIVMELLDGKDLTDRIEEGPVPPRQVAEMLTQVSKALQKAHDKGIIHRDIKPDNIFLCDTDGDELFCKLLDFGIAKASHTQAASPSTITGTLVGTPHYMSPEQAVGSKDIDHRTDLWSLGMVAFEALTCRRAFDVENLGALLLAINTTDPARPSDVNPALPKEIDRWFSTACARRAAERFSSAREMADAFWAAIGEPRHNKNERSGELSTSLARNILSEYGVGTLAEFPDGPASSGPLSSTPPSSAPHSPPPSAPSSAPLSPSMGAMIDLPDGGEQGRIDLDRITLDRARPLPQRMARPVVVVAEGRSNTWMLLVAVGVGIALLVGVALYVQGAPSSP